MISKQLNVLCATSVKAPNEGRDFSYSEQRQKRMAAEQITGMQADELLLSVGNRNPLRAKQNLYFKSKTYQGRFDQNPLNCKRSPRLIDVFSLGRLTLFGVVRLRARQGVPGELISEGVATA